MVSSLRDYILICFCQLPAATRNLNHLTSFSGLDMIYEQLICSPYKGLCSFSLLLCLGCSPLKSKPKARQFTSPHFLDSPWTPVCIPLYCRGVRRTAPSLSHHSGINKRCLGENSKQQILLRPLSSPGSMPGV